MTLPGPLVDVRIRTATDLPDLADSVRNQLKELHRASSPDRCDRMLLSLAGVSLVVSQLRTQLERGEQPTV